MSRIKSLNADQRAAIDAALDRLVDLPLRIGPPNEDDVRQAVRALYRQMRVKPPEIIFTPDPFDMARQASLDPSAGACLNMRLLRSATCHLTAYIKPRVIEELMARINRGLGPIRISEVDIWFRRRRGEMLGEVVHPGLAWQIASSHRGTADFRIEGAGRPILASQAIINCSGPEDGQALAWIAGDVLGLDEATEAASHLWVLMMNASFALPRRTRCWIAARPTEVHVDDERQLHCADGPAIRYPSGRGYFMWHGMSVPAEVMVSIEEITPQRISDQRSELHRQVLIERLGVDRFIRMSGADLVHEDQTGKLWTKRWAKGEAGWAAVEVVNGTPEPDGSLRHYFLQVPASARTAREAVAWTYGLRAEEYDVAVRT